MEVAAWGEAASLQGDSLGSFFPTGRWLEGRPVFRKSEGGTRYLRMRYWGTGWIVADTLEGSTGFLASGRATISPGDLAAGQSVKKGLEGWQYSGCGEGWRTFRGQISCRA